MTILKNYGFSLLLLLSVVLGSVTGALAKEHVILLKPLGDIFLNLLFTVVVPLVFFSIAASIGSTENLHRLGKIMRRMFVVFLVMGTVAAVYMLIVTALFPLGERVFPLASVPITPSAKTEMHFWELFTVSDFPKLFSRNNLLALIVFSVFIGCAVASIGEKGKPFLHFLQSGMAVCMKVTSWVMYYAPVGFFAYFAVLVGQWGRELLSTYWHIAVIYYVAAFVYFVVGFTFFVWLARRWEGVILFWKNILPPAITAFATCSSAASLPVNLEAAEKMNIAPEIYTTVIPVGTMLHKQGSILGGILKIVFLFSLLHLPFTGCSVWLMAIAVALLVGSVMGAIPGGGMLGEILLLSVYAHEPIPAGSSLILLAAISLIIDPIATLLNVTGNTVVAMCSENRISK